LSRNVTVRLLAFKKRFSVESPLYPNCPRLTCSAGVAVSGATIGAVATERKALACVVKKERKSTERVCRLKTRQAESTMKVARDPIPMTLTPKDKAVMRLESAGKPNTSFSARKTIMWKG
jgi:hypothetical protein